MPTPVASQPPGSVFMRNLYDPMVRWTGAWAGANLYDQGDVVSYGGSAYLCTTSHTNQAPPNVTYWLALSASAKLYDVTLGGSSASFDIQNINQGFANLMVVMTLRDDLAGTADSVAVRFNNDTGANYNASIHYAVSNTPTASSTFGSVFGTWFGVAGGNTGLASSYGTNVAYIPNYAGSAVFRAWSSSGAYTDSASSSTFNWQSGGVWKSTATINRVTIFPGGGSNWLSGSRVTVYGLA